MIKLNNNIIYKKEVLMMKKIYLYIKAYFIKMLFCIGKIIPDKLFIKIRYRYKMNKRLNLEEPKSFNEKLQWLKLYDRNPEYIKMVDKYDVKKYVSNIIGEEYIIPTIGIYNSFNEIDFEKLPKKFVMKCTHDSGGIVICKDKNQLNINKTKKLLNTYLKRNFFYNNREWPYKNVKPRIIIEKYMENNDKNGLVDYKLFCFNGEPDFLYISQGLEDHLSARMGFYDFDFNTINIKRSDYKRFERNPKKPENFDKIIQFSKILSQNIPHVRVDWYDIDGKIYFGELTFYTCSGYIPFETEEMDNRIGDLLILPHKKR